jgi:2-keto-4-pentenoate hydratase/2-oxohepta-3-ene-1,7-dioic acid hydratase in catechol pathway
VRLGTIRGGDGLRVVFIEGMRVLPLAAAGVGSIREIAAGGAAALDRVAAFADERRDSPAWLPLEEVELGPAIADPGVIYTIGLNYGPVDGPDNDRPERPLVYGKLPTSVAGDGATLTWDRALTPNVDAECELGVVVGPAADVFGYTIVNDVSSRDPWLDGDQWLLGKSMAGFCPVGPWILTADELDPAALRLGCTVNGVPIQDGSTEQLRFGIGEILDYLDRHVSLRPGDLIATGTPARLAGPIGPDDHLRPGDVVTCWIDGIGELTTTIA